MFGGRELVVEGGKADALNWSDEMPKSKYRALSSNVFKKKILTEIGSTDHFNYLFFFF